MRKPYVVYGQKGTGSVPVEATLLLLGEPYELLQPAPLENPEAGDLDAEAMARINPMQQVPALILANGALMTESAAPAAPFWARTCRCSTSMCPWSRTGDRAGRASTRRRPRRPSSSERVDQDPRLQAFWSERLH
ncbi:MAG: hypothetical protein ACREJ0_13080 [Geminicoccaceae bacterium]